MAELVKSWNDGGSLTATYEGSGDGSAVFSSDVAEGLDREMSVSFVDKYRSVVVGRKVTQVGLREEFVCADGDFILADGGTFNVLKHVSDLPDGYVELDYLIGDGSSYVITDFHPTFSTKIVSDVSDIPATAAFVYGVRDTSSGTSPRQFAFYRRTATTIRAYYFGTNKDGSVSDTMPRATIIQDKNVTTAYGLTLTNTAKSSGVTDNPLYIFALNDAGSATGIGSMKMYSMQIYDNDELVRDFKPCQNGDGVNGLYCKIMKKFYPLT